MHTSHSVLIRFNISTASASSLTLQYFCVDKSQSVSYKTLKVYLVAIRLMHIEDGFLDPTTDEALQCRGIRRQQSNAERTRLPITINVLRKLKEVTLRPAFVVGSIYHIILWISQSQQMLKPDMGRYPDS